MKPRRCAARLALPAAAACLAACGHTPPKADAGSATPAPAPVGWTRTPPPTPPVVAEVSDTSPAYERVLSNGLRVVVVEHHRRPIVSTRLVFAQGSAQDPESGIGSTYFAVSLLGGYYEVDADGRRKIEADSFGRRVFFAGGALQIGVTADLAYIGIDGFAKDASMYLKLLSGAVHNPRCGPYSASVRRDAMINALQEVELSDDIVFRLFINRVAFGAGHPYARPAFGTIDSLKQLSLRSIQQRQKRLLVPKGSTLLIVGDVSPTGVMDTVERTFGQWAKGRAPSKRKVRAPRLRTRRKVLAIPRSPAASMAVCAARPLSDIPDKDLGALRLLAEVLGQGLDSRLGKYLRMDTGLAYGFNAALLDNRYARALVACSQVRTADTQKALLGYRSAFAALADRPPTADEIKRAKAMVQARFTARYGTLSSTMDTWLTALSKGRRRPETRNTLANVSAEEVYAVAQRVLDPTKMRFILGGSLQEAQRSASAAGLGRAYKVSLDL